MKVTKCNSCGKIIDPSVDACYTVHGLTRVDKRGGSNGWNSPGDVDVCGLCWEAGTLPALEAMMRGTVAAKTLPQLNG